MTLPGIHDIPADAYHRDDLGDDGQPSLSATIAKTLLEKSPLHAWTQHPRLNENYVREEDTKFSIGTAAHALLLEGRNAVSVVHANDWKTNDAKEMRDNARAEGKVPLLAHQWADVQAMCEAVRLQIADLQVEPLPFTNGKPEQTISWAEPNGVACKARLDWLHDDYRTIDDLKTTSRSASHAAFSRTLYSMNYEVKAALYRRGIERLTGITPEFRFVAVETSPPYGLTIHSLTPAGWALGDAEVDRAVELWAECLVSGEWPCYDGRLGFAEPPAWVESAWLQRETQEAAV